MSIPIDIRKQIPFEVEQFPVPKSLKNDLKHILIPRGMIKSRVDQMALDISENYSDKKILAIVIVDGSLPFFNKLFFNDRFDVEFEYETLKAKSYSGTQSTDIIDFHGFDFSVAKDKHIVLVEDIIDTGNTLFNVIKKFQQHSPQSLSIACLLDKPDRRHPEITIQPDYTGFIIPDEFVIGLGLDYNKKYRCVPHIGVLKEEIYK